MSNSRMISSAFSAVSRVSNVSTRTFGFRSWIRAVADSSFDTPTVDVPWRIWRCRLVLSTTSKYTSTRVATPAAARYSEAGDPGDDRARVARLNRRIALGELPDVPVVHVNVHKAAQPTVRCKEVRLQRLVLAGEPIEQLPHTACLELDRVPPAHERAERRRDQNRHCHTTFRSSLVIGSWSNVPRSCARTQLFNSPARP